MAAWYVSKTAHLSILSWLPRYKLGCLLLIVACLAGCSEPPWAELKARLSIGSYFAASTKNAAFPFRQKNGRIALVVVDFATSEIRKLTLSGSDLVSPYLSKDGRRLLLVRHPIDRVGRELISCELPQLSCRSILKSDGSISFPIEITNGRILYISTPYRVVNGRGRYNWRDIWLYSPVDGTRKLTDFRLYEMGALTASRDTIYFSGMGPQRGNPVIPDFAPSVVPRSNIYRLPFDQARGVIGDFETPLKQLFSDEGISRSPYVSDDGSIFAFLRTIKTAGNYRFDLAVARNRQRPCLIPSNGLGYSYPVIVGESAYANDIHNARFWIEVVKPGDCVATRLAEVTDAQINSTKTTELSLNN